MTDEMMIQLDGRTDLTDLFRISGILKYSKLRHTPFLAFPNTDGNISVKIVKSVKALLSTFDDKVPVMIQWRGEWDSDFFRMTVGDVRQAVEERKPYDDSLG